MKKANIKLMLVCAVLVILAFAVMLCLRWVEDNLLESNDTTQYEYIENRTFTGEFRLADYEEYIARFPSNQKVEPIKDIEDAMGKGKTLIMEEYRTIGGKPYDPLQYCGLGAYYDANENCWLIKGVLADGLTGMVPAVVIRQNGDVLGIFYC